MLDLVIPSSRANAAPSVTVTKTKQGDKPIKSLIKTLSWRIIATLATIAISYFIIGDIKSALSIGGIEVVAKMVLYYYHERAWSKVGKIESNHKNA